MAHLRYITRHGRVDLRTDDGRELSGKELKSLLTEWNLRETELALANPYVGKPGQRQRKLVHNLVLSMPKGTPPDRLLLAVQDFAREQFGLAHRYSMALHTDQGNPHVHLVVTATRDDGKCLNIRKATLREWRVDFARRLREVGIAASATSRYAERSRQQR